VPVFVRVCVRVCLGCVCMRVFVCNVFACTFVAYFFFFFFDLFEFFFFLCVCNCKWRQDFIPSALSALRCPPYHDRPDFKELAGVCVRVCACFE
jgi:hypothetical protein